MELRKVLTLRGPNIWVTFSVLEGWVALTDAERHQAAQPQVQQRLAELYSQLRQTCGAACGESSPAPEPCDLPQWIARIAAELQTMIGGAKISYVHTTPGNEAGLYKILVGYQHDRFGRECLETAYAICAAAVQGEPYSAAMAIDSLKQLALETRTTPLRAAVLEAATAKGIPTLKMPADHVLQLGWGARQRRLLGAITDRTGAIAESIALDREATQSLLRSVGVPVVDPDDYETMPSANYRLIVMGQQFVAAVKVHVSETGAESLVDVTELVDVENTVHALEAAKILGLDVALLNVFAHDIAKPLGAENGGVIDLNARPDLNRFCLLSPEMARRIGWALVEDLFPGGQNGRIPVATVTGVNGKTTTTRLVAHIVAQSGKRVGMTCTDGIYIHGRRIDFDDCSGPKSARNVLMNPSVDAAVLETARGGLLREGLAVDRCDVAIVMNIGEGDHLGLNDIYTKEQLAVVKRAIVTAVASGGSAVLKADDPLVAEMASHCPGNVIFFCMDGAHPVMVQHREAGGRVVFVRENAIVLAEGALEIPLLTLDRIPLTHKGRVWFQVENAMAATAANWAIGTPAEVIRNGLESFGATLDKSPGRFNLLEKGGATVVVDYGHNTSSLKAMLDALKQFPHPRRYAVYSAAGDRRDVDMVAQGELLGHAFDKVYLYEDQYTRGREPGEIMARFREGLHKGERCRPENVVEVRGWAIAAEEALKSLRPGELLLLQADTVDEAVDLVNRYIVTDPSAQEVDLNSALHSAEKPAPAVKPAPGVKPAL